MKGRSKLADRVSSGSAAFDQILGGGFPRGSVSVIAGDPGTGKTILTLQMMFHLARQGGRSLYCTTLSEPTLKLMRFVQGFDFFDPVLFRDRIIIRDLGAALRAEGMAAAAAQVKENVEHEEPDLVAIDSAKVFHDFAPDHGPPRSVFYDLAVTVAAWEATTFLVGEYRSDEIGRLPEFGIADGIIQLRTMPAELTKVREIEVLKLRGSSYVSGQHFFDIDAGGVTIYPRVRAPDQTSTRPSAAGKAASTGVSGLDALLGGGLPRRSATVVEGSTGIGKTLLGLHFLLAGARAGEPGILLTLEETPEQLWEIGKGFGWDLAKLERQQRLFLHYSSPVELSTDRFLNDARQRVERVHARRVVLDSLTSVALGVASERRFRELIHAMTKHFRAAGVTVLMTSEVPDLLGFGSTRIGSHGVSSASDNVILMRYCEIGGRLERAISVLKARGAAHDNALRRVVIDRRGMRVAGGFTDLLGVLTGVPTTVREPSQAARRNGGEQPRRTNASQFRRTRSR